MATADVLEDGSTKLLIQTTTKLTCIQIKRKEKEE
jgi:hypothetical protein